MGNDSSEICNLVVDLLAQHGVSEAVVSPGSRNAPILVALARTHHAIRTTCVIDERCAAFVALGMASTSGCPVALVCTSGSAMLNYAPAIAEAYYRCVPLIVISADRSEEMIDQDDSQTIRQRGALDNIVKRSYDIGYLITAEKQWYANRVVNDAIIMATSGRRGPVHINVQIDNPVYSVYEERSQRMISLLAPQRSLSSEALTDIAGRLAKSKKVLIVAGFMEPSPELNKALRRMANMPNVVVMCETIANLHSQDFISSIDSVLSIMSAEERSALSPDVVLTLGGALVSRMIKQYLRAAEVKEHWHVGVTSTTVDCLKHLTMRIDMEPSDFFVELVSAMSADGEVMSDYARRWRILADKAFSLHQSYVMRSPWSDMKAFHVVLPKIPRGWNVQFSNGTPIRYAQLFAREYHRCDCNRGVSGIDGCTSTAIGASLAAPERTTLLVTGDMSASYDLGALSMRCVTNRMKIVVIRNGGGGIFRFVESTRVLSEVEELFCVEPKLPLKELACGYGWNFYTAESEVSLRAVLPDFMADTECPSILEINTPSEVSAEVLRGYFKRAELS